MGEIQSAHITSEATTQVTTQRTKFLGVDINRATAGMVKVEVRNGTSGSSTVLFTLTSYEGKASSSMIFPAGDYILCGDGLHVTTTGSHINGVTLIYQS